MSNNGENMRSRDEVLREFGRKNATSADGSQTVEWIDKPWSKITEAMADRIRELEARAERMERVVEAARPWIADLWRGDLNGTAIGVCMEYEPDGQYVLWEQVAPIAEAVRALDAAPTRGSDE